jgi:curved DNA-binding protein CbpA
MLGVPKNATVQEVMKAWRRKMLASHPDKNGGSEESVTRSKALNDAKDRALLQLEQYKGHSFDDFLRQMNEQFKQHEEAMRRQQEETLKRQKQETLKRQKEEAKRQAELKMKMEQELKKKQEEELKRKQEEELKKKQEEELRLKRKKDEELKLKKEQKRKAAEHKRDMAERKRVQCENARRLRLIEDDKKRADAKQTWLAKAVLKKAAKRPEDGEQADGGQAEGGQADGEQAAKKKRERECVQEFIAHARGNEPGLQRLKGVCHTILLANSVPRERLDNLLSDARLYMDGWTRSIKRVKV